MISITGDRHGEEARFSDTALPDQSKWTEADKLIIAGDFGFVFQGEKQFISERNKLDTLAEKKYEILFVDGNHEGFDFLFNYPEEVRYGAPVRRIRDNVFWLQRGYVYTIEGKTFFVMGGAYSIASLKGFFIGAGIRSKTLNTAISNHYAMMVLDTASTLMWLGCDIETLDSEVQKRVDFSMLFPYFHIQPRLRRNILELRFLLRCFLQRVSKKPIPHSFVLSSKESSIHNNIHENGGRKT